MADRILLVEDDRKLAPLVQRYLEDHHFDVCWAPDGDRAWREFQAGSPDLVILDLMLPGRDGLSLCRDIRARSQSAILMLTAKGDESDRVIGLELGADDYLTKPFSLKELLARVKAILRRYHLVDGPARDADASEGHADAAGIVGAEHWGRARVIGPFAIDPGQRSVHRDGAAVELTRSEFDILDLLTRHPGQVFSRDRLLQQIRGGETEALDRAVDTHISNLRRKLEADPKKPEYITTVWGLGYRWSAP
ncbi:response regulator [Haliangium sp.]|uniref:response regulator n=1 Tax=Haliangium sp. TaxID=2663208 RepID=UPI003D123827